MLVLRFLNVVAPAYFLCISVVTFVLQIFLFIPSMFKDPSTTPLFSSALLYGALFLFLSANALGNYILVIQNSPGDLSKGSNSGPGGEAVANWPDGSRTSGAALPGTHFCRLCARVTQRHDHHCFFTGNCIGSRNMRNFIMFCLYTSLACLDSLVAGVAYISAVLSTSFANPLAFLTLLPHSISQFFSEGEEQNQCDVPNKARLRRALWRKFERNANSDLSGHEPMGPTVMLLDSHTFCLLPTMALQLVLSF
ncbi:UNVERIFIED_CONTAM: Palmitoyltransferase zdhhc22 [Gekko kuhli]